MRRISIGVGLCVLAVAGLAAADAVWQSKPFTEWTDKEVQAVLTDSPWAGKASLTNARAGGGFSPVPDWKVTVAWRSALPVRQALVRQVIGQGGKVMADHQAMLSVVDPSYIVMIQGVPSMYGGMIERIGATTTLERDGKPPIPAQQGVAQLFDKNGAPMEAPARGAGPAAGGDAGGGSAAGRVGRGAPVKDDGSTATLIFGFPKNDPISAADKEVEFSTTIGAYHVKRKFRVKDMLINGEPAL